MRLHLVGLAMRSEPSRDDSYALLFRLANDLREQIPSADRRILGRDTVRVQEQSLVLYEEDQHVTPQLAGESNLVACIGRVPRLGRDAHRETDVRVVQPVRGCHHLNAQSRPT